MKKPSELLKGLNPDQARAVKHASGPLLIVAGAGTGKTTVITRRIAWLIEQRLAKPSEILALTFTEKAAGEMEERIDRLLPYGYLDVWISTFHSFGQRILERHGLDIGLPVNFKVITETGAWLILCRNLEKLDLSYYRPLGSPARFLHALIRHFSRAKDELITPTSYAEFAKGRRLDSDHEGGGSGDFDGIEADRLAEVAKAYGIYQKLLAESAALDFGDLINCSLELFRRRPAILSRYQRQFKYILVDEFQDTNFAQYELVRQLAQPKNNLTVVGDDDQSIYKFRGASVSNILKFKEHYPHAVQISLTRNYRSRQNLLDLAYKFIQENNPERLEIKLAIAKRLVAEIPGQAAIELRFYGDFHEEAEKVAQQIISIKTRAKGEWSDFAILLRANESSEIFAEALEQANIPVMQLSRRGLYRKGVIVDAISYFRLLDNYHENRAMFRVMALPQFAFTHEDLSGLTAYAARRTVSVYEALKTSQTLKSLSAGGQESAGRLLRLLEKHARLARERSAAEVFVAVIEDLKLATLGKSEAQSQSDAGFLDQFYRKLQDFCAVEASRKLKDFMEVLEMEIASGEQGGLDFDPDIGPEAVKIITVHSAKGLEFEHVFLPGLVEKRFPAIARGEPIELPSALVRDILPEGDVHIQEERRLFYVAMTRARAGLYFSYAADYGGASRRRPSAFLREIGLEAKPKQELPAPAAISSAPRGLPAKLVLPKTHSFTSLSTFKKCALEYKYTYLFKLPRPGTAAQSFGLTVHRALENYLKLYRQMQETEQGELFSSAKNLKAKAELPPLEKLQSAYRQAWVDDWYVDLIQKSGYKERGERMMALCYEHFKMDVPKPKYIEQPFKLSFADYAFTGKLDRADERPQGLRIIDYKTGGARERLEKVDKEQLFLYQLAAREFLGEKVESLEYWYWSDKIEILKLLGTPEELEEVKTGMIDTLDRIAEAVKRDSFNEIHARQKRHECEFKDLM